MELHPHAALRGHRLEVWSLALCPDKTTLVSGSKDGSVLVWDTATLRNKQDHVTLPVPIRAWRVLPDGQAILTLDKQGRVARWQGTDFHDSRTSMELGTEFLTARFSADARFLAAALPDGKTRVWDLEEGRPLREFASDRGREVPVMFRSNHLVTQRGRDASFREWDVTTGREIRDWSIPAPGPMWKSAFSLDEQWCVAVSGDGIAQLRHLATGRETRHNLNLEQVSAVALSTNGRLLAAVSVLGMGQLWDTTAAQPIATLHGFLQGTHSVDFSPDSRRLAIGSNGNEAIKLWDVESLQELLTLKGQGSMFGSTAFSADGNLLASSNSQGILHIWRAPSFKDIARLEAQDR
jgi:WD40 repeat protein